MDNIVLCNVFIYPKNNPKQKNNNVQITYLL